MLIHPSQSGADKGFLGPEFYTIFGAFSQEHKITEPKLDMRMNIYLEWENCKFKNWQMPQPSQNPEK